MRKQVNVPNINYIREFEQDVRIANNIIDLF